MVPTPYTYLGDGVYAMVDGYHIILKTGSPHNPDDTIYLDRQVRTALAKLIREIDVPEVDTEDEKM